MSSDPAAAWRQAVREGKITEPQGRALAYLATVEYATPSQLGQAMGGTLSMKAQGLGRLGGTMAWRLIKMGLASDWSRRRAGFPAYSITAAGRAMLSARPAIVPAQEG